MESAFRRSVKRKLDEVEDAAGGSYIAARDDVAARVEVSNELSILRETLASQQNTIQDLILELDEERNAASTAANEAMSMILRLQREKAEIQMEFRQFKRFAEERIAHDQQELMELDDLLLKKDEDIKDFKNRLLRYENCENCDGFDYYPPLKCTIPHEKYEDCENYGGGDCKSFVHEKYTPTTMDQLHNLESRIYEMEAETKLEAVVPDPEFSVDGDHNLQVDDEDDESARVYTIDAVHAVSNAEDVNDKGEKFVQDGDIKKLYMRLQALEADRESMRQAIISMRTEKAQLVLLKEIAQQLCKEVVPEKKVVKKQSLIARFLFVDVIKWILSFIFWRKKASRTKYSFGLSSNNVGLLLLLDKTPCVNQWRCPASTW